MRACSPRRLAAWTLSSLPPASASVPAALEAADYPNLIRTGETVSTIAVPAVLAVFNWPKTSDRYRRVSRFVEAYFTKFDQLQQPPFSPNGERSTWPARF